MSDALDLQKPAGKKFPDDRQDYWKKRSDALFYRYTVDMAREFGATAHSAIDIGCFVSPVICHLDWVPVRIANDLNGIPEWKDVEGVTFVQGDAFGLDPQAWCGQDQFDIVICHQTIEHIEDAKAFAHNLCAMGKIVLCSTSYQTEAGLIPGHIQDPIDVEKFESWFPRRSRSLLIERRPDPRFSCILGVF